MHDIAKQYTDILESQFNIIGYVSIRDYWNDFRKLDEYLKKTRKEVFDPHDRYVVDHGEVCYYMPHAEYSLDLFNVIRCFIHQDIDLDKVIIMSYHTTIERELDLLIPKSLPRPTVFHGLTWLNFMHDRIKNDVKHDPKDITHHAVCLIRNNRVHRSALYNGIKHLKDKILIKYRGDYLVS